MKHNSSFSQMISHFVLRYCLVIISEMEIYEAYLLYSG